VSVFHDGELAVQRRAGVEATAAKVGRNVTSEIPPGFSAFLAEQPFLVIGGQDADHRVWASLIVEGPGFARALDDHHVRVDGLPDAGDPLTPVLLRSGARVGLLAIQPHTRSRIRLNGAVEPAAGGFTLAVEEVFGNCPKYIRRRLPVERLAAPPETTDRTGTALDGRQIDLISRSDTFFIASVHAQRGADVSHRGGEPGFVEVTDATHLRFPDYLGNRMFQTLGNLEIDPRAGLLFLDWESGLALQLTGRAEIVWDEDVIAAYPGAERVVTFAIDAVREHAHAMPARWENV
jgi:predicted pyridoxine 5'-phosphate oxidase superfamily flavin-nucleotide-binding protein